MASIENLLKRPVAEGVVPSLAVFAKRADGSSILSEYINSKFEQYSIDSETNVALASVTKMPTTVAALQIVEKGLIQLDDDVTSLLPVLGRQKILAGFSSDGSPILKERRNPITLRHLLTHSSGAGYDFMNGDLEKYQRFRGAEVSQGSVVEERFNLPLLFEPGEGWMYSCGVDWAGKVVEKLSGMSLDSYLREHIWKPLGKESFTFWPTTRKEGKCALLAERRSDTNEFLELPQGLDLNIGLAECFGGQGGYSTSEDVLELLHSLLANDGRVLKSDTADMMFRGQLPDKSREALRASTKDPSWAVGGFYEGESYDWGLGGLLVDGTGDAQAPHPRGPKTLMWSGATNLFWFIDRSNGLCGLFVTQLLPPVDPATVELMTSFQKIVYQLK